MEFDHVKEGVSREALGLTPRRQVPWGPKYRGGSSVATDDLQETGSV